MVADAQIQYHVGGMSCSFCAETIRKAYERTDGVGEVDVSLAHEEVLIQFDDDRVDEVELKDTVRDLGYTIRDRDKEKRFEQQQAELEDGKRDLLIAGGASLITALMMGVMIAGDGWNLFAEAEAAWMSYASLGLALLTMFWPGRYIKEKAYNSLKRGIFNQHVLLEAGAFAGLAGGFLGLFVWPDFPTVHFFAVSTFITTYHILSEYTSLIVRTRASRAVEGLMDLRPDTARRVTGAGAVEEVEVEDLVEGDRVRVKPGENIPVDGEVVDGESTVDESVATGESAPIDKQPGDDVIGGSVNQTGTLLIEVTATGADAFLNQVARQIEEARAMKPGIVQLADRVLRYFVPGVLTIAALAFAFWAIVPAVRPGGVLGTGPQLQRGAFAALAVFVLGYPCALGMATPLALIRGGGEAADRGILMRSGDAFQIFQDVDTIILDKTGTITEGEPAVDEIVRLLEDERGVLRAAASAEAFSEHPLADAILERAEDEGVTFPDPEAFDSATGKGVTATVEGTARSAAERSSGEQRDPRDGSEVLVGKPGWLEDEGIDLSGGRDGLERLQNRGLTAVGVAVDGDLVGLVGIGDEIKTDAADTIARMSDAGITPVMITGDNERTAHAVAERVGIDRVMAEVLPDDKRREVGQLQNEGRRVAVVGDGINDAPALTQADIGIAIGAGTDIAIESADIVLMGDRLGGVMDAYEIGKTSYSKTKQNLIAAFSFNGIGVTAATTGLVHPVFAMLAMVSSVTAVLANSFAGQLISGEGINTDFSVETADPETDDAEETDETDQLEETAESSSTETAADVTSTEERSGRERVTFGVDIHCGGCEDRITETLDVRDGICEVHAEADDERVEVEFNPHLTSADEIRAVVADLGYEVEDVPSVGAG